MSNLNKLLSLNFIRNNFQLQPSPTEIVFEAHFTFIQNCLFFVLLIFTLDGHTELKAKQV
jgi:hypothetical protein